MSGLMWRKEIQEAGREITGGTRLLLLFFSGGKECEGTEKLLEETFHDDKVVGLIEREAVPVMFDITENKEIAGKYHVDWTPTLVIADENGTELERFVGYLPSRDFMAQMTLSKGLAAFHMNRLDEARREFELLVAEFPESELVPEAEYYLGATKFKETGDTFPLGEISMELAKKYPDSIWTKKCSVWAHDYEGRRVFVGYDQGGSAGSGAY